MLTVYIPGQGQLEMAHLVLDYNGTVAQDGQLLASSRQMISQLAQLCQVHIITADTHGTVAKQCSDLPVKIRVLTSEDHVTEKAEYVAQLGRASVIAVGNGENDWLMLETSKVGIAIIGPEGCAGKSLRAADIVVNNIRDAFNLVLIPKRLIATLRTQ